MPEKEKPPIDLDVPVKNLVKNFYIKASDIKSKKDEAKKEIEALIKCVHDNKTFVDREYNLENFKLILSKMDGLVTSLKNETSIDIKKDYIARTEATKRLQSLAEEIYQNLKHMADFRDQIAKLSANLFNISMRETLRVLESVEIKLITQMSRYSIYKELTKTLGLHIALAVINKDAVSVHKKEFGKKNKENKAKVAEDWKKYGAAVEEIQQHTDKFITKYPGFIKKGLLNAQVTEVKKFLVVHHAKVEIFEECHEKLMTFASILPGEFAECLKKVKENIEEFTSSCLRLRNAYEDILVVEELVEKITLYGNEFTGLCERIKTDSICSYISESSNDRNTLEIFQKTIHSPNSIAESVIAIKDMIGMPSEMTVYIKNLKTMMHEGWGKNLGAKLQTSKNLCQHAKRWSSIIGEIYIIRYCLYYIKRCSEMEHDDNDEVQTRVLDSALILFNKLAKRMQSIKMDCAVSSSEKDFIKASVQLIEAWRTEYLSTGQALIELRKKQIHTICFNSYISQVTLLETVLGEKETILDKLIKECNSKNVKVLVTDNKFKIMRLEVEGYDVTLQKMKLHVEQYFKELTDENKECELRKKINSLHLLINDIKQRISIQMEKNQRKIACDNVKKESDIILMMADVTKSIAEEMKHVKHSHPSKNLQAKIDAVRKVIQENKVKANKLLESIGSVEQASNSEKLDVDQFKEKLDSRHKECEAILLEVYELRGYMESFQSYDRSARRLVLWIKRLTNLFQQSGLGCNFAESSSLLETHSSIESVTHVIGDLISKLHEKAEEKILSGDPCSSDYREVLQQLNKSNVELINSFFHRERNLRSALLLYQWVSSRSIFNDWAEKMITKINNLKISNDSIRCYSKEIDLISEYQKEFHSKQSKLKTLLTDSKTLTFPISITNNETMILIGVTNHTPELDYEIEIKKDHLYFLIFEYDQKLAYISDGCVNGFAHMRYLRKELCSSSLSNKACAFPTPAMINNMSATSHKQLQKIQDLLYFKLDRFTQLSSKYQVMSSLEGLNLWIETKKLYISTELHQDKQLPTNTIVQILHCLRIEIMKKRSQLEFFSSIQNENLEDEMSKFMEAHEQVTENFNSLENIYVSTANSFGEEIKKELEKKMLSHWINTMKRQNASIQMLLNEAEHSSDLSKLQERANQMKLLSNVIQVQYKEWLDGKSADSFSEHADVKKSFEKTFREFDFCFENLRSRILMYTKVLEFEHEISPIKAWIEDVLTDIKTRYDLCEVEMVEVRKSNHKDTGEELKQKVDSLEKIMDEHNNLLSANLIGGKMQEKYDDLREFIEMINDEYSRKTDYLNDMAVWKQFNHTAVILFDWLKSKKLLFEQCLKEAGNDDNSSKQIRRLIEMVRNKKEKYDIVMDHATELLMAQNFASDEIQKIQDSCKEEWNALQSLIASCKVSTLTETKLKQMNSQMDQQILWLNDRIKQLQVTPQFDFDRYENQHHSFNSTCSEINVNLSHLGSLIRTITESVSYASKDDAIILNEKLKKLNDLSASLKADVQRHTEFYQKAASLCEIYKRACDQQYQLSEMEKKLSNCSDSQPVKMVAKLDLIKASLVSLQADMNAQSDLLENIGDKEMENSVIEKIKDIQQMAHKLQARVDERRAVFLVAAEAESIIQDLDEQHNRFAKALHGISGVQGNDVEERSSEEVASIMTKTNTQMKAKKALEAKMKPRLARVAELMHKIQTQSDALSNDQDKTQMTDMAKQFQAVFSDKMEKADNAKQEFEKACNELMTKYSGVLSNIESASEINDLEDWSMKRLQHVKKLSEPSSVDSLALMRRELEELQKVLEEKEMELKAAEESAKKTSSSEQNHLVQSANQNMSLIRKHLDETKRKCDIYEAGIVFDKSFGAIDAWIAEKSPDISMNLGCGSSSLINKDTAVIEEDKAKLILLQDSMKQFHQKQIQTMEQSVKGLVTRFPLAEAHIQTKLKAILSRWDEFNKKVTDYQKKVEMSQHNQNALSDLMQQFARLATQFCASYDCLTEKFTQPASSLSKDEFQKKRSEFENLLSELPKLEEIYKKLQEIMEKIIEIYEDSHNPHTWYTMESIDEMWNSLHMLTNDKRNEYSKEHEKMVNKEKNLENYEKLVISVSSELEQFHQDSSLAVFSLEEQESALQLLSKRSDDLLKSVQEICLLEFKVCMTTTSINQSTDKSTESGYVALQQKTQNLKNKVVKLSARCSEMKLILAKNSSLKEAVDEAFQVFKSAIEGKGASLLPFDQVKGNIEKCKKLQGDLDQNTYFLIIDRVLKSHEGDLSLYGTDSVTFLYICLSVKQSIDHGFQKSDQILEAFGEIAPGKEKISEFDLYQALGRELAEFCLSRVKLQSGEAQQPSATGEGFNYMAFCQNLFTV